MNLRRTTVRRVRRPEFGGTETSESCPSVRSQNGTSKHPPPRDHDRPDGNVRGEPCDPPAGDDDREPPRPETTRQADPYPLDLAFSRRTFVSHEKSATSPNGRHVAYAVTTPTKQRDDLWTLPSGLLVPKLGTRLHVVEIATGKSIDLGAERATSFTPAWSPDGTKLAYYSDEGGSLCAGSTIDDRQEPPCGGRADQGAHV